MERDAMVFDWIESRKRVGRRRRRGKKKKKKIQTLIQPPRRRRRRKNGKIKRDVGKPRKTQDAASERHAVGCHRSNEIDGNGSMRDWPSGVMAVGGTESISVWEEQRRREKEKKTKIPPDNSNAIKNK